MEFGLQMFSVRDITKENLLTALEKVAAIGYKGIEFAGFFGVSAEEVKTTLDKLGLSAWGTHTGWDAITDENIAATIAYHKTIGCKKLIIPGADLSTADKLTAFIDCVNKAQPILAAEGITLGYHNHSHEFVPNNDGQIIYDELLARTSIALELDTYWAFNAKKDPIAMMDQLSSRLYAIHIKDGDTAGHGYPLGMGSAPVKAVFAKAVEMGLPMVVESETLTPDGITEAKICFEFLTTLAK